MLPFQCPKALLVQGNLRLRHRQCRQRLHEVRRQVKCDGRALANVVTMLIGMVFGWMVTVGKDGSDDGGMMRCSCATFSRNLSQRDPSALQEPSPLNLSYLLTQTRLIYNSTIAI